MFNSKRFDSSMDLVVTVLMLILLQVRQLSLNEKSESLDVSDHSSNSGTG